MDDPYRAFTEKWTFSSMSFFLKPAAHSTMKIGTEVSHSNGPFVFQPGHLILTNSFSKEVINPADISTPKIWDQSDNWFKSYGQKVNFLLTES